MRVNIQTLRDIRYYLAKELKGIYQEPEISALANIIIKTEFGLSRLHQLNQADQQVTGRQIKRIIKICDELKTGKPVQYILGETIFYDCILKITSAALIPRPETEELVDLVIRENSGFTGNIVDLGTGSGCIAIALARNLHESVITGIDISDKALRLAQENALLNSVPVSFLKGDIFNFDFEIVKMADIIVSNPPYVRNSEKQHMGRNILDFEPQMALFVTDSDPLIYYHAILKIADKVLLPCGRLYFEINEVMGKPMTQLLEQSGYSDIEIVMDVNNKERIIKGRKDV